jgi:uncharacterized membrane protein HdeD (DUF308 family)
MEPKPGNVLIIGILMLASGVLNILTGSGIAIAIIFGTFFVGLICLPVLLIPIGIGIYEVITGVNTISGKPARNIRLVAGLEIASLLWANILSMVAGILVLVFYNDAETESYFLQF